MDGGLCIDESIPCKKWEDQLLDELAWLLGSLSTPQIPPLQIRKSQVASGGAWQADCLPRAREAQGYVWEEHLGRKFPFWKKPAAFPPLVSLSRQYGQRLRVLGVLESKGARLGKAVLRNVGFWGGTLTNEQLKLLRKIL